MITKFLLYQGRIRDFRICGSNLQGGGGGEVDLLVTPQYLLIPHVFFHENEIICPKGGSSEPLTPLDPPLCILLGLLGATRLRKLLETHVSNESAIWLV